MLDLLSSPLRGYIAQNLQFYLSKYIEGIQLEGIGLFGGDLVLNDLEIKRHVLVPKTPMHSIDATMEVTDGNRPAHGPSSPRDDDHNSSDINIDNPKSGWLRDTLQKILTNVTIQHERGGGKYS
ncbi:hypothetical protein ATCC90586_007006 [Pythium insidiosum]|nr:hypothetical protein ATCC90586_007006 [Pythium insidiosum]